MLMQVTIKPPLPHLTRETVRSVGGNKSPRSLFRKSILLLIISLLMLYCAYDMPPMLISSGAPAPRLLVVVIGGVGVVGAVWGITMAQGSQKENTG